MTICLTRNEWWGTIPNKNTLLLEEKDIVYLIKEKIGLKNFLIQLMDSLETGFKKFADNRITGPGEIRSSSFPLVQ